MSRTRAVVSKELATLWASPLPYVVGALFNALLGVLFVDQLHAREQAVIQPLFPLAGFLLLALIPLLTMRAFAEERRLGTLDLLRAVPVPAAPLVLGKWLAAWLTVLITIAPSLLLAGVLLLYGDPDTGPMISGYLGLVLLAAAVAGIGVLASALTASQPVAATVSFLSMLLLWFAHAGGGSTTTGAVLAHLSLSERLRTFAEGGIAIADVGFLIALGGLALVGAVVAADRRRIGWVWVAAAVVLLLVVEGGTDRAGAVTDLTAERSLSLTSTTKDIVAALHRRVEVTAFIRRDQQGRVEASTLLDRYHRLNRQITYRVLDPNDSPGEVRRLGVDPVTGGVAVVAGSDIQVVPTAAEQDITTALARIERHVTAIVCTELGHGELSTDSSVSTGMSAAIGLLRANGYAVTDVDLLSATTVPDECDALIVAFPTTAFGAGLAAVDGYLARGGRMLALIDPDGTTDLQDAFGRYGLELDPGVVLERDPSAAFEGDASAPVVSRYSSGNPIVRNLAPTFFPVVQGIEVTDSAKAVPGLTVSRLADTSPDSVLQRTDGSTGDGPITVAAAADLSAVHGQAIVRTRIVAVGDGDFVSNALLKEAGNSAFFVQAVDWLTLDENLVAVTANLASPRPLELTDARRSYALFLSAGVVPGLFLLAGAMVWALRRSR